MTFPRKKLRYEQLPQVLHSFFKEDEFLKGYDCSESDALIVWVLNRELGKQQEIEFSLNKHRILTRQERSLRFPLPDELVFPDLQIRVIRGNQLEQGTDVRYQTYEIHSLESHSKLATCEQIYYMSDLRDVRDVVVDAIAQASFPQRYASWSTEERAGYWMVTLYRLRRWVGESGEQEDAAFGADLIDSMRSTDSGVDAILPLILTKLAAMESIAVDDLLAAFNQRTGLSVTLQQA